MKAFFVGLLFLVSIAVLSFLVILLIPIFATLNIIIYILFFVALAFFLVWLLGKILLWGWEAIKK